MRSPGIVVVTGFNSLVHSGMPQLGSGHVVAVRNGHGCLRSCIYRCSIRSTRSSLKNEYCCQLVLIRTHHSTELPASQSTIRDGGSLTVASGLTRSCDSIRLNTSTTRSLKLSSHDNRNATVANIIPLQRISCLSKRFAQPSP